jgi:hypothetical protein
MRKLTLKPARSRGSSDTLEVAPLPDRAQDPTRELSLNVRVFYVNHSVALTYRIYGDGLHQFGVFVDDGSLICDGIDVSAAMVGK